MLEKQKSRLPLVLSSGGPTRDFSASERGAPDVCEPHLDDVIASRLKIKRLAGCSAAFASTADELSPLLAAQMLAGGREREREPPAFCGTKSNSRGFK